jgi:PAS domain S-box-containing protein
MALFARGHVTGGRRPHVPHVNTRALRFFETFETSKQVDIDQLFAGMSVTRRDLTGPQRWISWDDFAEIYDRFVRTLGPAALEAAGEQIIAPAYLGPFLKILGIFSDPIDLYRVGLRWFAPTMYRSLSFTITQVGAGRLEIVVEIPSAHRPSEAFLRSATGGFRALPRALGSADASVEATITGRRGRYLVTVPPAKRVTATLRRALAALRGADAVIDELADQQAKIAASHEALVATELGFHSALEALPVGVGVQREGRWLYVNSAMAGLVGVRPAELLGHPVLDLVDEHDRPRVQALMSVASLETAEVRLALGDTETYVECGATGGMVFNGEPAELFFAIDLTARRAAQRAAARSEGITKAFLDVLPDLVLRIDRSGVLHEFRAGRGHPDVGSLQPFVGTSVVLVAEALSGVAKAVTEEGLARLRESLDTRRELTVQIADLPMQVGPSLRLSHHPRERRRGARAGPRRHRAAQARAAAGGHRAHGDAGHGGGVGRARAQQPAHVRGREPLAGARGHRGWAARRGRAAPEPHRGPGGGWPRAHHRLGAAGVLAGVCAGRSPSDERALRPRLGPRDDPIGGA